MNDQTITLRSNNDQTTIKNANDQTIIAPIEGRIVRTRNGRNLKIRQLQDETPMKPQTQTELPGVVAVVETITCRGHELAHLAETLKAQGKRIITMTAVCQSSWRCTIATLPEAAGQAARLPTAQALAANQTAAAGQ